MTDNEKSATKSVPAIEPCAVILLTPEEFKNLPRPRQRGVGRRPPLDIWSLQPYLTDKDWRLVYRIVELGGQIAIFARTPGYKHKTGHLGLETELPRLTLYKDRLPRALTPIHIEETMNPAPNQGHPK